MRVGFVFRDLNESGAPAAYYSKLVRKVGKDSSITPVAQYVSGDASTFDIKLEQRQSQLPNWHKFAESHSLDLIHLNGPPIIANYAAAQCPVPVIATIHGTLHWADNLPLDVIPPYKYRRKMQFFDRVSKYTIDCAFCVSKSTRNIFQNQAGWPKRKLRVTNEAINDRFFESQTNQNSKWESESYLLHVSSSAPKKNVPSLIKAYAKYHQRVSDPHDLVVAGSGWEPVVDGLLSKIGCSDSVLILGHVGEEELIDLYDHATLFVFPSLHETFGLPNIESMARGTPVLTTRRYGISDIVSDTAAYIDSPTSIDSIANSLIDLLGDPDKRSELSEDGEQHAKQYSWKRHIQKIEEGYREVLT